MVTDNDKTDFQNLKIGNSTPLVKVIKVISTTEFQVSPAISTGALPGAFKIDFSRTSMENLSEQYLSNYSIQTAGATFGTVYQIRIDADAVLGGVPRVGDIVTNLTSPNNVPHPTNPTAAAQFNLRITDIQIDSVSNTDSGRWTITFDVGS